MVPQYTQTLFKSINKKLILGSTTAFRTTSPSLAVPRSLSSSSFSSSTRITDDDISEGSSPQPPRPSPIVPYKFNTTSPNSVPAHILKPSYARTGHVKQRFFDSIIIHDKESIDRMRNAAQLARRALDYACTIVQEQNILPSEDFNKNNITAEDIDAMVHQYLIENNAYPSPLNYSGFPKSICSSVNEVICHGIPDSRPLQYGDIVSFDVSCFLDGVHGDNCATVIVGENSPEDSDSSSPDYLASERRLVKAAQESLDEAIKTCHPGSCLTEIGNAISSVLSGKKYNNEYSSVKKYRGHGIGEIFHCAPYVKHFRNMDSLELREGMIFTIEPMIVEGKNPECYEWECDGWTVVTQSGGRAAQFEHTVLITDESESGVEILTVP